MRRISVRVLGRTKAVFVKPSIRGSYTTRKGVYRRGYTTGFYTRYK